MIEIADVFRRCAADYVSAHGASMLPSHRRAIENILDCRTAALGGQVWRCDACGSEVFSFHSCGNRSCPKCHTAETQECSSAVKRRCCRCHLVAWISCWMQ